MSHDVSWAHEIKIDVLYYNLKQDLSLHDPGHEKNGFDLINSTHASVIISFFVVKSCNYAYNYGATWLISSATYTGFSDDHVGFLQVRSQQHLLDTRTNQEFTSAVWNLDQFFLTSTHLEFCNSNFSTRILKMTMFHEELEFM